MTDLKLPSTFDLEHRPLAVVEDRYYPENELSARKEHELKKQIVELSKDFEPWQAKACQRYAYGEGITSVASNVKRANGVVKKWLDSYAAQQVLALWHAVQVYQQGPNEAQRRNMLWRIALDNEKEDPKEARGAIAELNRMDDAKRGIGGNKIEIVINNELLPRTKLDA